MWFLLVLPHAAIGLHGNLIQGGGRAQEMAFIELAVSSAERAKTAV